MAVTVTNLIQGPATIYAAPFGTTEPTTIAGASGAGVPGVGWVDCGGTKDGVSLKGEQEYAELTVDQIVDSVGRRRIGRKLSVAANLAEATLANLALALGNSAPAANLLELDNDITTFQPVYGAIIIEGPGDGGFKRRIIARKTLITSSFELAYKKDEQAVLAVEWALNYVSSSIKMLAVQQATS